MKRLFILTALICGLFILAGLPAAHAEECDHVFDLEMIKNADVIFEGKVISIADADRKNMHLRQEQVDDIVFSELRAMRPWKGLSKGQRIMIRNDRDVHPLLMLSKHYFIVANEERKPVYLLDPCAPDTDIGLLPEYLEVIKENQAEIRKDANGAKSLEDIVDQPESLADLAEKAQQQITQETPPKGTYLDIGEVLHADGITVLAEHRSCETDADCATVSTHCGGCACPSAVSAKWRGEYADLFKRACEVWGGKGGCEMECLAIAPRCVAGKCSVGDGASRSPE